MKVRNTYRINLAAAPKFQHLQTANFLAIIKPVLFSILSHSPRKSLQFTNLINHRVPKRIYCFIFVAVMIPGIGKFNLYHHPQFEIKDML